MKHIDLGVSGGSGPSIAANGTDFFLMQFAIDLPEPVYDVSQEEGKDGEKDKGEDESAVLRSTTWVIPPRADEVVH